MTRGLGNRGRSMSVYAFRRADDKDVRLYFSRTETPDRIHYVKWTTFSSNRTRPATAETQDEKTVAEH